MTKARDALSTKRRMLPMVRVDKDYRFEGPTGRSACSTCSTAAASSSCSTSCSIRAGRTAARAAPAASDELSDGCCATFMPRHHVRRRLPCATREDRAVQGEAGLDVPVVLVVRERLQLRLPRHARRVGGAGGVQLPGRPTSSRQTAWAGSLRARPSSPATACSSTSTASLPHVLGVARGTEWLGGSTPSST